jgi:hypothetical protein
MFDGVVRKYRPDFLIRVTTGTMLVLEVKGQDSRQNEAKRARSGRMDASGERAWRFQALGLGA